MDTRDIVLIHTTLQNRHGCDPAIDIDAPGASAALSAYQRSRSEEDRAKLPLRAGMRPALFTIARLSQSSMRFVMAGANTLEQAQQAVLVGCHRFTMPDGTEHRAAVTAAGGNIALAEREWLDVIADEFGASAIVELGTAILQWTQAPKRALTPFGSVPGLVLAL